MVPGNYKVIAEGGLWLRDKPSTNAAEVTLLPNGDTIAITANAEQNGFAPAKYGQLEGWAAVKYLQAASMVAPLSANLQSNTLAITGEDVALRRTAQILPADRSPIPSDAGGGNGSNVVVFTHKDEVVENMKTQENAFQRVKYKGLEGWMSVRYLANTDRMPSTGGVAILPALAVVPPAPIVKTVDPASEKITTEVGPVSGGVLFFGLVLAAGAIYFLAK